MKKTFISFIATIIGCLLLFTFVGCTKNDEEVPAGSGESIMTGISAHFNTEYETLKGNENIHIYRLKTGQTYEFVVSPLHRGSKDVKLGKGGVEAYYDTRLLSFEEGEYLDEPDSEATPTDDFPYYFTCCDTTAFTEIFVVANSFWCKVAVIIEN